MIQLFGNALGHDASTAKAGMSPAWAVREVADAATRKVATAQTERIFSRRAAVRWPRCCAGFMAFSPDFLAAGFPLARQSIAGRCASQFSGDAWKLCRRAKIL